MHTSTHKHTPSVGPSVVSQLPAVLVSWTSLVDEPSLAVHLLGPPSLAVLAYPSLQSTSNQLPSESSEQEDSENLRGLSFETFSQVLLEDGGCLEVLG